MLFGFGGFFIHQVSLTDVLVGPPVLRVEFEREPVLLKGARQVRCGLLAVRVTQQVVQFGIARMLLHCQRELADGFLEISGLDGFTRHGDTFFVAACSGRLAGWFRRGEGVGCEG